MCLHVDILNMELHVKTLVHEIIFVFRFLQSLQQVRQRSLMQAEDSV